MRGCAADEDGGRKSQAGRSPSSGAITAADLPAALERVFSDARVQECIVQHFREGPSGVVFSLAPQQALAEYSAVHGGVTSGSVRPFTAILPHATGRHRELSDGVARVHAAFGPCDIEFVGLERPSFVQVRPVTAPFSFDVELARVAMLLQELEGGAWELTSYGVDLMERPEQDAALRALFLERVGEVYQSLSPGRPRLPARPFLKIGVQTFMDRRAREALRPGLRRSFVLGMRQGRLLARARADLAREPPPPPQRLMDVALHLNLLTDIIGPVIPGLAARLLPLRERCRELLARALPEGEALPDIPCSRRLAPCIERDDVTLTWKSLAWAGSRGLEVVPGDFESGPFVVYRRNPAEVPAGCVLVTSELFPELASVLPRIKAVVSEGGSFGSHLAILAREQRLPLRIQSVGAIEATRRDGRP